MKPGFEAGIAREITFTVTDDMCPACNGVIIHRCYSTWSAVHHMELAARKVLADFLQEDEDAIGTHVSVDHLAPCPIGRTVSVRACLIEVAGRRVICEVTAHDGDRLLARGRHVQAIINKEALRRVIERC